MVIVKNNTYIRVFSALQSSHVSDFLRPLMSQAGPAFAKTVITDHCRTGVKAILRNDPRETGSIVNSFLDAVTYFCFVYQMIRVFWNSIREVLFHEFEFRDILS